MNFTEVNMLQFEKHKAMIRYHHLHKLAKLARSLELLFAMALFSRSFPAIADLFALSLRWLCKIAVNQHFVFLLGNLIVVALFVKSGRIDDEEDEHSLIRQFLPPPTKLDEFEAVRTRSEEFEVELRRQETETEEEDLSDEEFQRKVEAFIERQQRFLREESLSMAIRNRSSV